MVKEIKDQATKFFDYAGQSVVGAIVCAAVYIGIYSNRIDTNTDDLKRVELQIEQMRTQLVGLEVIKANIEEIRKDQSRLLQEIKEIRK